VFEVEGLDARIRRHTIFAESIRSAATAMGIDLFPTLDDVSVYSNTVTALKAPYGIKVATIKNEMRRRGIVIAGGQSKLKDKIIRIGNMGNISKGDILNVIEKLEMILAEHHILETVGAGSLAADEILEQL